MSDKLYNSFRYLFPPRPEQAVMPNMFPFFERRGWIAQIKMNGTCSVIFVPPNRKPFAWNRHNTEHKAWQFDEASAEPFKNLPGNGWYVFVGELLHSKVPGLRNINYLHDMLVEDGIELRNSTYAKRIDSLRRLFLGSRMLLSAKTQTHFIVNPNLWIATDFSTDFKSLFESLDKPEQEGLVLKNPKAKLALCDRDGSNSSWQVKSRKRTKNFSF